MASTKVVYENNGIVYIEPNYTDEDVIMTKPEDTNEWSISDRKMVAPKLENYCVAVELSVQVPKRGFIGSSNRNGGTYVLSWDGSKTNVSFFGGTEINGEQYYTTAPYEYTTLKDVLNADGYASTSECFGIKSINVRYDNYAVPTVEMELTDIRGMSLFSPEEMRHSKVQGGIPSSADDLISGSFFKCFFMFPYPKFQFTMKGFYGEPLSYELTCADFRASFNASSGNFDAKIKLIGYAFSILTDVSMNHLIVAPHELSKGAEYWESKDFRFDSVNVVNEDKSVSNKGGTPIPKITEVIKRVNSIRDKLTQLEQNDESFKKSEEIESDRTSVDSQINALNDIIDYVRENAKYVDGKIVYETNNILCFACEDVSGASAVSENEFTNRYVKFSNELKEKIKVLEDNDDGTGASLLYPINIFSMGVSGSVGSPTAGAASTLTYTYGVKGLPTLQQSWDNGYFGSDENVKNTVATNADDPNGDKCRYFTLNYDSLKKALDKRKEDLANKQEANDSEIKRKQNSVVEDALGFSPSVQNITKMILAHFETLIHCIHSTAHDAEEVAQSGNRTLASMGFDSTDVKIPQDAVPPYPRVEKIKTDSKGQQIKEDEWLGKITSENIAPEIRLVEGFVEGTNKVAEIFNKAAEDADPSKDGEYSGVTKAASVKHLGGIVDLINENSWVSDDIDTSDYAQVVAVVALRFFTTLGMNSDATSTYADDTFRNAWKGLAEQDAKEFARSVRIPDKMFLSKLLNTNDFKPNNLIACLTNKSSTLFVNNKIPWGDGPLLVNSGGTYVISTDGRNNIGIINKGVLTEKLQTENIGGPYVAKGANGNNNYMYPQSSFSALTQNMAQSQCKSLDGKAFFKIDVDYKKYMEVYESFKATDDYADIKDLLNPFEDLVDKNWYRNGYDWDELYSSEGFFFNSNMFIVHKPESDPAPNKTTKNCVLPKQPTKITDPRKSAFTGQKDIDGNHDNFGKVNMTTQDKDDCAKSFAEGNDAYSVCRLSGIDVDGSYSNGSCIFGAPWYYSAKTDEMRAFMFLASLDDFDYGVKAIRYIYEKNVACGYLPYHKILLMGAYLTVKQNINKHCSEGTTQRAFFGKYDDNGAYKMLLNFRVEIQKYLIDEFESFVKGEGKSPFHFTYIQKCLELKNKSGGRHKSEFVQEMAENLNENLFGIGKSYDDFVAQYGKKTVEEFCADYFSNSFFESYFSFGETDNNIALYIRPNSAIAKVIFNLVFTPCVFLKGTTYLYKCGERAKVKENRLREYLEYFFDKLKDIYKKKAEDDEVSSKGLTINKKEGEESIRKGIYKYHKQLYDNWISGNGEEIWNLENFYAKNWHFMDVYYKKIGYDIMINIDQFCSDIMSQQTLEGFNLASFLSRMYSKVNMSFQTVQNFLSMIDKRKFERMFDAIPYSRIDWDNINKHPDFIAVYFYEGSSKLNMGENATFSGDSFDISDETDLPTAISMKQVKDGYRIPAFGVTYGMQYQSYFKDIKVGMENPVVTEQSLRAQFMLASAALGKNPDGTSKDGGESPNHINFIGQDLFTIYANNSYTCEVTMMGCAWIQPLMYFQLNNIPLFRGAYMVQKVTHTITPGNMETRFVGTRIAKVQSPIVNNTLVTIENSTTSNEAIEDRSGEIASIDNNCDYKHFTPNNGNGASVDTSELVLNVPNHIIDTAVYKNKTILEGLAATAYAAVGNSDELSYKICLTVYYNLYHKNGWGEVFHKKRTECEEPKAKDYLTGSTSVDRAKLEGWVRDVFENSPSVIVGQQTKVLKSINIYENGQVTNNKTESKAITLEDVQMIDQYASPYSYWDSASGKTILYEGGEYSAHAYQHSNGCKDARFIYGEYRFQHDFATNFGHVYISQKRKKYWEAVERKETSESNEDPSEKVSAVVEAIKKTIDYSSEIKIDTNSITVERGTASGKTRDSVYLSCGSKEDNAQLFDVILNTYYDELSNIAWMYDNDSSELPTKVYITANNDGKKNVFMKQINAPTIKLDVADYGKVNEKFKKSLKKKYGATLDESNFQKLKNDCMNFNFTDKATYIEHINSDVFGVTLEECRIHVNGNGGNGGIGSGSVDANGEATLPTSGAPKYTYDLCKLQELAQVDGVAHNKSDKSPYIIGTSSKHQCVGAVAAMLYESGLQQFTAAGWAGSEGGYNSAYGFGFRVALAKAGFKRIWCGHNRNEILDYTQNQCSTGDVAVMTKGALPYSLAVVGHGCVFNGENWVSDFVQKSACIYNAQNYRFFEVWRYDGDRSSC